MSQSVAQDDYSKEVFMGIEGFSNFDNEEKNEAGAVDSREEWIGITGEGSNGYF